MHEWTTYSAARQLLGGDGGKESRGDEDELHVDWYWCFWRICGVEECGGSEGRLIVMMLMMMIRESWNMPLS